MPASICPVWLHLWMHTEESVPASYLLVLSTEKHLCGQVLQDGPLVSDSSPGLGKKKKKKRGVLHNCQSRGNNSSLADFILSSLDEHKPCSRDVRGVCLMCICQLRAQSGKAVSRKVSTRTSFSLWTAQSDWVNLSAQTGKQGKKSIVPEAQSPTSCSNWCWVLERWQENVGKIFTVLCNVRSSFFLFS